MSTTQNKSLLNENHPYKQQLLTLVPSPLQLSLRTIQTVYNIQDTPVTHVTTITTLQNVILKLNRVQEIAISMETHLYRTFNEVYSLLSIATYQEHFLIDLMALKADIGLLNPVLTDPNIVVVMHSSDRDLDRLYSLGLYVINMFDTQVAARLADNSQPKQLFQLLSENYQVEYNRDIRLRDWTVRPLPSDMVEQARLGAHYLLHMRDKYQNMMLMKPKSSGQDTYTLPNIYTMSRNKCVNAKQLKLHLHTPDAYMKVYYHQRSTKFNKQQVECLRLLYEWRFRTAESNDESMEYTLPNKIMIELCKEMPTDTRAILQLCTSPIPTLVEHNVEHLRKLICTAISNVPDNKTIVPVIRDRGSRGRNDKRNKRLPIYQGVETLAPPPMKKSFATPPRGGGRGYGRGAYRGGRGARGGGPPTPLFAPGHGGPNMGGRGRGNSFPALMSGSSSASPLHMEIKKELSGMSAGTGPTPLQQEIRKELHNMFGPGGPPGPPTGFGPAGGFGAAGGYGPQSGYRPGGYGPGCGPGSDFSYDQAYNGNNDNHGGYWW